MKIFLNRKFWKNVLSLGGFLGVAFGFVGAVILCIGLMYNGLVILGIIGLIVLLVGLIFLVAAYETKEDYS